MNNNDILASIEYADSELISKAESYTAKKNPWLKWAALAACLCLAVLGAIAIPKLPTQNTSPNSEAAANHTEHSTYALYTDRIILPETEHIEGSETVFDMIGCLVYKGHVYTQGPSYFGDIPAAIEQLVGDYVGEAKGTLDEWSTQDDYAKELASTYSGPVYSVKGYSEDFRLCIFVNFGDERNLVFLDNFDGIGLTTGKDLFDDRFHIKGNVNDVHYLSHYDWDYVGVTEQTYKKLFVSDEQFDEFIDVLLSSPFEQIDHNENPDFYEAEVQGHLYLDMKDGTRVELTLIDGGYVGCAELGWFFVHMSGDIFDAVLSACQ